MKQNLLRHGAKSVLDALRCVFCDSHPPRVCPQNLHFETIAFGDLGWPWYWPRIILGSETFFYEKTFFGVGKIFGSEKFLDEKNIFWTCNNICRIYKLTFCRRFLFRTYFARFVKLFVWFWPSGNTVKGFWKEWSSLFSHFHSVSIFTLQFVNGTLL